MCIHDNITLRCLTEDFLQFYNRKLSASDNISQNISRTNTRKLVLVTDQNQSCSCSHCHQKRMHQMNIYHRHLIYDDHICFQRILRISLKMNRLSFPVIFRHSGQLQHTVNSLCLISCCLRHPLRSSAGRCCQPKLCPLTFKEAYDCIARCRLTCTGTSCQHQKSMSGSFFDCFFLHFIQHCACFFLDLADPALNTLFILRTVNIQFP